MLAGIPRSRIRSVVAIQSLWVRCCLVLENTALAGEKPAKHAHISKVNPVCTSHTDRASGVDVLAPLCCRSGVWQFSRVSLTLILGMRYGFGRSRQPRPT